MPSCASMARSREVCFGANVPQRKCHVRFTPNSGHVQRTSSFPLWANSGHREHRALRKEWAQVRFSYYGPRSAIKMPTTRYRPRNPPSSRHTVWKNRNDVREKPSRRYKRCASTRPSALVSSRPEQQCSRAKSIAAVSSFRPRPWPRC